MTTATAPAPSSGYARPAAIIALARHFNQLFPDLTVLDEDALRVHLGASGIENSNEEKLQRALQAGVIQSRPLSMIESVLKEHDYVEPVKFIEAAKLHFSSSTRLNESERKEKLARLDQCLDKQSESRKSGMMPLRIGDLLIESGFTPVEVECIAVRQTVTFLERNPETAAALKLKFQKLKTVMDSEKGESLLFLARIVNRTYPKLRVLKEELVPAARLEKNQLPLVSRLVQVKAISAEDVKRLEELLAQYRMVEPVPFVEAGRLYYGERTDMSQTEKDGRIKLMQDTLEEQQAHARAKQPRQRIGDMLRDKGIPEADIIAMGKRQLEDFQKRNPELAMEIRRVFESRGQQAVWAEFGRTVKYHLPVILVVCIVANLLGMGAFFLSSWLFTKKEPPPIVAPR